MPVVGRPVGVAAVPAAAMTAVKVSVAAWADIANPADISVPTASWIAERFQVDANGWFFMG